MSARSAAAVAVQQVPKVGTSLLLSVAAAIVCPFDGVLSGMVRAGLGIKAICAYLGLSRAILDHNLLRLDLPTPHDRPRRKAGRLAWTDEELRCAIYWRLIGVHPESIGLVFSRSANAVRSKVRRIGVPPPDRWTRPGFPPQPSRPIAGRSTRWMWQLSTARHQASGSQPRPMSVLPVKRSVLKRLGPMSSRSFLPAKRTFRRQARPRRRRKPLGKAETRLCPVNATWPC